METSIPIKAESILSTFRRMQPKNEKKDIDPVDAAYEDLSLSQGWKQLKELIAQWQVQLENEVNVQENDSIEAVGFRFLAARTAKAYLQSVIDVVESSHGAINQP